MVQLLLNPGKQREYKNRINAMSEPDHKQLPVPIQAKDLEAMIGPSQAFSSWDASTPLLAESHDCWPYLFSDAALPTEKKPAQ